MAGRDPLSGMSVCFTLIFISLFEIFFWFPLEGYLSISMSTSTYWEHLLTKHQMCTCTCTRTSLWAKEHYSILFMPLAYTPLCIEIKKWDCSICQAFFLGSRSICLWFTTPSSSVSLLKGWVANTPFYEECIWFDRQDRKPRQMVFLIQWIQHRTRESL